MRKIKYQFSADNRQASIWLHKIYANPRRILRRKIKLTTLHAWKDFTVHAIRKLYSGPVFFKYRVLYRGELASKR